MGKSFIRRNGDFAARFTGAAQRAELAVAAANKVGALLCQQEVVARVPVKTGVTRSAFADPEAVGLSKRGGKGAWEFGLRTPNLRKKGYKAAWIEYGTKGYKKGDVRTYRAAGGDGTRGGTGIRKRKISRVVPARPAQPFFRTGIEAARAKHRALVRTAVKAALKAD